MRGEKGVEGLLKREKVEGGCQVMGDQTPSRNGTVSLFHSRPNPGLPGGPVAKNPCCQCRGPGFDPWLGARSHLLQLRVRMPQLKLTANSCSPVLSLWFHICHAANFSCPVPPESPLRAPGAHCIIFLFHRLLSHGFSYKMISVALFCS